jgi:transposase-like protein
MQCLECQSQQSVKNGTIRLQDQSVVQKYLCKACGKQFNERTGTPMARLRTPLSVVELAMNVRTEGLGVRATGRSRVQIALDDSALGGALGDTEPAVVTGRPGAI